VTFFLAVDENVTPVRRIESSIRFKTLLLQTNPAARFCEAEVGFAGAGAESFPLRDTGHAVSLRTFATPTALETSAV
jgi:hypothetical protein